MNIANGLDLLLLVPVIGVLLAAMLVGVVEFVAYLADHFREMLQ